MIFIGVPKNYLNFSISANETIKKKTNKKLQEKL